MDTFSFINFHQTRDFSRKMNVTFEFAKQNFKPLAKSILVIAGPPILIASLFMGTFVGDIFSFSALTAQNGSADAMTDKFLSAQFWMQIGVMMIFFLISGVTAIATVNNYLVLYEEKKSNKIEVHEVWERVRQSFWMNFGTMILFGLLGLVSYFILAVPMVVLAAISPWLIFFGFIIMFCGIFYVFVGASMVFIIRTYEKIGFFDALMRSFKLIQGKWWSTFGLLFILSMVVGMVSYAIIMPWYIVTITNTIHDVSSGSVGEPSETYQVMTTVVFSVYYLVQMVLYAFPNIGLAFQYFNLVERRESRGLMNQISAIGQAPTSSASSEEQY